MKGKNLWNYLEEEARRKLKRGSFWKLCSVDIKDEEIAEVVLVDPNGIKAKGLVYYGQKEATP